MIISRCLPSTSYPSVSVGVPVYNGAEFLRDALDSLVAQDYPNFEIHVSDNASTDETWSILQAYREKCDRFRIHRWQNNVGAVRNFQHVLLDCDATYFMWAAHDDVWSANFISEAMSVFREDASAVMVNAKTTLMDRAGRSLPLPPTRPPLCDLAKSTYPERIEALAQRVGWCLYGLCTRDSLLRTSVLGQHEITQDVILTYDLAGIGTFRVLENATFNYRIIPKTVGKVAENLGIEPTRTLNSFSRMFGRCVQSILFAAVAFHETEAALGRFLRVCADHGEWWPNISSEQQWDTFADIPDRLRLLEELSRNSFALS